METYSPLSIPSKAALSKYLTYKEWKQEPSNSHRVTPILVSTLPIRNGNLTASVFAAKVIIEFVNPKK